MIKVFHGSLLSVQQALQWEHDIINRNNSDEPDGFIELGFGWKYKNVATSCGHEVEVRFVAGNSVQG